VDGETGEAGTLDGGTIEGGAEAGPGDAGDVDAGAPDLGPVDRGAMGGGTPDLGPVDLGAMDAGTPALGMDAGTPDDGPDASAVCPPLPANPANVYVDQRSTMPEVGTMACPFRSILSAVALPAPTGGVTRTVHLAGASGGLTCVEAGTVVAPARIGVVGEGRAAVVVATGSPATCVGGARCTVDVRGGGELRALSVRPAPGGVPMGDGMAVTAAPSAENPATIADVDIGGFSSGAGFHLAGAAALTGVRGAVSERGLHADIGTPTFTVALSIGTGAVRSAFENHALEGVLVARGPRVDPERRRDDEPLARDLAAEHPRRRDARRAVLRGHGQRGVVGRGLSGVAGIVVGDAASTNVGSNTILRNGTMGLVFRRGASNALSASCNVFATHSAAAMTNGRAAFCVEQSGATGRQAFRANVLSTTPPMCPATQEEVAGSCLGLAAGYHDLAYVRGAGGGANPIAVALCDYCG
jgi:hypothetical protein